MPIYFYEMNFLIKGKRAAIIDSRNFLWLRLSMIISLLNIYDCSLLINGYPSGIVTTSTAILGTNFNVLST